jgi:hypothetical protein
VLKELGFNLLQHQEIISKLPEKISQNLEREDSERNTEISIEKERKRLVPGLLVLSSTVLIASSTIDKLLLYKGLIQFSAGVFLYMRSD